MRYLKTQSLNNRAIFDKRFYLGLDNSININSSNTLSLPVGSTAERPVSPRNGMIRYNTTINNIEVYQSSVWREMRFAEPNRITQQTIGYGDGTAILFGPLDPEPPMVASNGAVWGGQHLIVLVENVFQLNNTNYTVVQNPQTVSKTYTGTISQDSTTTRVYLNTAIKGTNAAANGAFVTVGFDNLGFNPFSDNSMIVVENFIPASYNGLYPTFLVTNDYIRYETTVTDEFGFPGTIASVDAIYPVDSLIGATVTGTNWTGTIVSYELEPVTGALLYFDVDTAVLSMANSAISITTLSAQHTGYYLSFNAPVPYGKIVTVLHGFDL